MDLTILTPQRKIVESLVVDELFAPGQAGTLDILPNHANLLTELETGVLKWRVGSAWRMAALSYGWLEIQNQHITVLADVAETAEEINAARARQAEENARRKVEEGGLDDEQFQKYELKLKRAMARNTAIIGLSANI